MADLVSLLVLLAEHLDGALIVRESVHGPYWTWPIGSDALGPIRDVAPERLRGATLTIDESGPARVVAVEWPSSGLIGDAHRRPVVGQPPSVDEILDLVRNATGRRPSRVWHPAFGWAADADGETVLLHPDDWPEAREHARPEDYDRPRLADRKGGGNG